LLNLDYNRPETPPNTPQRAQAAARQNERNNRILDSPQQHRIPHNPGLIHVEPLHFNHIPIPLPPGNQVVPDDPDDPFALPAPNNYTHLPPHLAQQLHNLPAFPAQGRGRGRGRGQGHVAPVSVYFAFILFIHIWISLCLLNIIICLNIWLSN